MAELKIPTEAEREKLRAVVGGCEPLSAEMAYRKARASDLGLRTGRLLLNLWDEIDRQRAWQDRVLPLLRAEVDDEPCQFDHYGSCQQHGASGPPCRNVVARELIEEVPRG